MVGYDYMMRSVELRVVHLQKQGMSCPSKKRKKKKKKRN